MEEVSNCAAGEVVVVASMPSTRNTSRCSCRGSSSKARRRSKHSSA